MLGVNQCDLDALGLDGAALVAADDLLAVQSFGSQPDTYLVIANDRGLGLARDLQCVVNVIEVTVRDQHEVALVDRLQHLRSGGIVHDPRVDEYLFALGAADLPGPVTDPGKADVRIERHAYSPIDALGSGRKS